MKKWLIRIGATCILIISCITLLMSKVSPSKPNEFEAPISILKRNIAPLEGYIRLKNTTVFFESQKFPGDFILLFPDELDKHGLQTGDKVNVWTQQILESSPAKIIVRAYEKIE